MRRLWPTLVPFLPSRSTRSCQPHTSKANYSLPGMPKPRHLKPTTAFRTFPSQHMSRPLTPSDQLWCLSPHLGPLEVVKPIHLNLITACLEFPDPYIQIKPNIAFKKGPGHTSNAHYRLQSVPKPHTSKAQDRLPECPGNIHLKPMTACRMSPSP